MADGAARPEWFRVLRRFWAAFLIAVLTVCPLSSVCLAHAAGHTASAAAIAHPHDSPGHDQAPHGEHHSKPIKADAPDGCTAIQHCAPFSWTADLQSFAVVFEAGAVRFAPVTANIAHGIISDPEVPPPRLLS